MECPKCHKFVQPTWVKCPHCKAELQSGGSIKNTANADSNPLLVYKNKAIWKIAAGELSYHVRESELENFDEISGLIIEEGVKAYIYVDGTRMAELSSGAYEFVSQEEIDKILETHIPNSGLGGTISGAWKAFVRLFTGKKVGNNIKDDGLNSLKTLEDVAKHIRQGHIISIYLHVTKENSLLFDINPSTERYQPMTIRTAISDIDVAVAAQIRIADYDAFLPHYHVGKRSVTLMDLQRELAPEVRAVLSHVLANETIDERGFSADVRMRVESELKRLNSLLNGVEITRIVELSCSNSDFDRFREVAKELYLQEREIDYMHRTQEMRNRVASMQNEQTIHDARSRYELDKALREVNKDELLNRQEYDKFVMLLDAQMRLEKAKSEYDERAAYNDLLRSGMVSEDEVDKLKAQLLNGKIQRDNINEMLLIEAEARKAQAQQDVELRLTEQQKDFVRDQAIKDAKAQDEIERIEIQRNEDQARSALDRLREMKRIHREDDMERKDQDYRHEEYMADQGHKHQENMARIQAEVSINDSRREVEALRELQGKESELYQQMSQEKNRMFESMMGNMKEMVIGATAAAGGNYKPSNNEPKAEKAAEKPAKTEYYLPIFGNVPFSLDQIKGLIAAGSVQADTIIRVNGQDWAAGTLKELSDAFNK